MSELTEHQKLQAERRKDYEIIKDDYAHLKQVIINDETLEQVKAALKKFKSNKKLKATGLRFNPALPRWLNVARDRIIRWERDHPESEPEPKPEKEPEIKTTEKTIVDTLEIVDEVESSIEHVEETPEGDAHSADADEETDDATVESESEDENPHDTE